MALSASEFNDEPSGHSVAPAEHPDHLAPRTALHRLPSLLRALTLFAGLGGLFLAGALAAPEFLTIGNQRDVLSQVAINGILAVGMTLVILTGGIDLSVGSLLSLCTVVCAMLLMERPDPGFTFPRAHWMALAACVLVLLLLGVWRAGTSRPETRPGARRLRIAAAIALSLLPAGLGLPLLAAFGLPLGLPTLAVLLIVPVVGACFGAVNGLIIAHTRLQPFIVTLAMMVAAYGLAKYVAGEGGRIHAIYTAESAGQAGADPSFEKLGATILTVGEETGRYGQKRPVKLIPVPGLFLVGAWLLAAFILHKLPLGRYVYAVGGNEEAARLAGVPVPGVKVFAYAASGALAGLAAVLYCAQYEQGKADAGQTKELDAIAAVVIGGTSLLGGRGSILGTLVGVMIFGYLTNILQLRAVSSEIQDILKGVIIVAAAVVQSGDVNAGLRRLFLRRA